MDNKNIIIEKESKLYKIVFDDDSSSKYSIESIWGYPVNIIGYSGCSIFYILKNKEHSFWELSTGCKIVWGNTLKTAKNYLIDKLPILKQTVQKYIENNKNIEYPMNGE